MDSTHTESFTRMLQELASAAPGVSTGEDGAPSAVHDAPVPARITKKNIFRHPHAHPVVLDLLLLDTFGPEWLGWEAETVKFRVPVAFDIDVVSDLNMAKLQAMKTLHLVDTFWERWEVFGWCTMALNGVFPDFQVLQVPDVTQAAIAVDIAGKVRTDVPWSDEVRHYLSAVHRHDELLVPQSPLDFVEVPTVGLPLDAEAVAKQWPAVKKQGQAPTEWTAEAEQLRRMLDVYATLEQNRGHMRSQLGVLRHG